MTELIKSELILTELSEEERKKIIHRWDNKCYYERNKEKIREKRRTGKPRGRPRKSQQITVEFITEQINKTSHKN